MPGESEASNYKPWTAEDERVFLARPNIDPGPAQDQETTCLADWHKKSKAKEDSAAETARVKRLGERYFKMSKVVRAHKEKHGEIPIEIYVATQNFMVVCEVLSELQDLNAKLDCFFVEDTESQNETPR